MTEMLMNGSRMSLIQLGSITKLNCKDISNSKINSMTKRATIANRLKSPRKFKRQNKTVR
jgi:hypothetical protein